MIMKMILQLLPLLILIPQRRRRRRMIAAAATATAAAAAAAAAAVVVVVVVVVVVAATTTVRAVTPRETLQIKLSISPSHGILTPGRPVLELILQRQAPGRVAIVILTLKSLV